MKKLLILLAALLLIIVATLGSCMSFYASFGRLPEGERLERIKKSPNYRGDKFQNITPVPQITSGKSKLRSLIEFVFRDTDGLRPEEDLPSVKTDLSQFSIMRRVKRE